MVIKSKIKNNWNYIAAMLIPWVIVILQGIMEPSWFRGETGILMGDASTRAYPLFVELWNKIHTGESLFYSWNGGSGFDFYLNFIYYLISPLNILPLLLPKSCMELALQIIMLLKWSLSGVTMTYYFMNTKQNGLEVHKKLISVILGLGFCLSNCIFVLCGQFYWMDILVLFPVLLLMIERMCEQKTWKGYYILLTIGLFCNYSVALQLILFLFIWLLLQEKKEILLFLKSTGLALLSSFVVVLPGLFATYKRDYLNLGKNDILDYVKSVYGSLFDVGQQLMLFKDGILSDDSWQPKIFFSIGLFAIAMLYFVLQISKGKQVKNIVVLVLVFLSLCTGLGYFVFHGFRVTDQQYQTHTYMFVFLMLYMALQVFMHLEKLRYWNVGVMFLVEIGIMIGAFFKVDTYQAFYGYFITFVLVCFYNLMLIFYVRKSIKYKNILVLFCVVVVLELVINGCFEYRSYYNGAWKQNGDTKAFTTIFKDIEMDEGDRVVAITDGANGTLLENVNGVNGDMAYYNEKLNVLCERLGYYALKSSALCVNETTPCIDVLFNIRYRFGKEYANFSDGEVVVSKGDYQVLDTKYRAGLGYMVDDNIVNWNPEENGDFDLQNAFVKACSGVDSVFTTIKPEAELRDAYLKYKKDDAMFEKGYYSYEYTSCAQEFNEYSEFQFRVEEDMDLYLFAGSEVPFMNFIMVDETTIYQDEKQSMETYYHIGNVKKGQTISVFSKHAMEIGDSALLQFRLAKFEKDRFEAFFEKVRENKFTIDKMTSNILTGAMQADKDGVMMTSIPAMDGFTVYVDDKETNYESIGNAWIGIPLTKGTHQIKFKYQTPYFKQGLIGSLVGILLFIMICFWDKKHKKEETGKLTA